MSSFKSLFTNNTHYFIAFTTHSMPTCNPSPVLAYKLILQFAKPYQNMAGFAIVCLY